MVLDDFLRCMMVLGGYWWLLIVHGGFREFWLVFGGSCWFLVVLGGFW